MIEELPEAFLAVTRLEGRSENSVFGKVFALRKSFNVFCKSMCFCVHTFHRSPRSTNNGKSVTPSFLHVFTLCTNDIKAEIVSNIE